MSDKDRLREHRAASNGHNADQPEPVGPRVFAIDTEGMPDPGQIIPSPMHLAAMLLSDAVGATQQARLIDKAHQDDIDAGRRDPLITPADLTALAQAAAGYADAAANWIAVQGMMNPGGPPPLVVAGPGGLVDPRTIRG